MVSAQIPGTLTLYIENTAGVRKVVAQGHIYKFGPGGSSVGVIANTPEKWSFAPMQPGNWNLGGYKLVVAFKPIGAATLDISDAVWQIPIYIQNQGITTLNNSSTDFATYLIGDSALVAGQESILAIHTAPEGRIWKFGGDRIFMSVEDNA